MEKLKVYDTVNKNTVELDEQGLIDIFNRRKTGRCIP